MIDWSKVNDLRREVGEEDFDEVVALFLSEVDETLTKLGKPGRSLEEDLHFLKGCALNLGFSEFSSLCSDRERSCTNGQDTAVDPLDVQSCYETSKVAFFAEMDMKLAS